ncbi:hypothetical protein KSC_108870 [Ktedonobacter sp. SOSP1-52]|nr:hypothetical protein KSC_108870 [Ktedonobacter sp. SOSP1-52]
MPRQIMRENLFSKIVWSAFLKPILGKFYDTKAQEDGNGSARDSFRNFLATQPLDEGTSSVRVKIVPMQQKLAQGDPQMPIQLLPPSS